jgi:hypothetical protein
MNQRYHSFEGSRRSQKKKQGIYAEFKYLFTDAQVDNLEKSANLPNRAAMRPSNAMRLRRTS